MFVHTLSAVPASRRRPIAGLGRRTHKLTNAPSDGRRPGRPRANCRPVARPVGRISRVSEFRRIQTRLAPERPPARQPRSGCSMMMVRRRRRRPRREEANSLNLLILHPALAPLGHWPAPCALCLMRRPVIGFAKLPRRSSAAEAVGAEAEGARRRPPQPALAQSAGATLGFGSNFQYFCLPICPLPPPCVAPTSRQAPSRRGPLDSGGAHVRIALWTVGTAAAAKCCAALAARLVRGRTWWPAC